MHSKFVPQKQVMALAIAAVFASGAIAQTAQVSFSEDECT